jgi:hypothetical protein
MSIADSTYSGFLSLPTELRCHVYHYLLAEPHAITVSAGYVTCFGNRIQDRARKTEIPGLPLGLTPLARHQHDTSLLSVAQPPTVAVEDIEGEKPVLPAPLALLLTSRTLNDELTDYMRGRKMIAQARSKDTGRGAQEVEEDMEGLSLYVSYPYGVLVLKSLYPFLLKQARRVYISGHYTSPQDDEPEQETEDGEIEGLTPSNSFAACSFTTPTSGPSLRHNRSFSNASQRTARHSQPRLRLDSPTLSTRTTTAFPPFPKPTSSLAPAVLSSL